jgi:hypothetical protein
MPIAISRLDHMIHLPPLMSITYSSKSRKLG